MPRTVIIDPSVIWIINGRESADKAAILIEIASKWLGRRSDEMRRLALTRAGMQALYNAGIVPSEPYFQDVIEKVGLKGVVGARQLATAVAKFLASIECADDFAPFSEALFDNQAVAPDPGAAFEEPSLQAISIETACFIALNATAGSKYVWGLCSDTGPSQIEVQADVIASVPDYHGDHVLDHIDAVFRDADYYSLLDSLEVWKKACSVEHYMAAICLKAAEIDGIKLEEPDQVKKILSKFKFGTNFIATLVEGQSSGEGEFCSTVLQKCAQIISIKRTIEIRDFRISAERTASVRKRKVDGAIAKRVHVTDKKRGLRLMFWECSDGCIEFATLANKFDEYIDE